jgi:Family of unknown function (DUF6502)
MSRALAKKSKPKRLITREDKRRDRKSVAGGARRPHTKPLDPVFSLLVPLTRLMISAGVDAPKLSRLLSQAYVLAASEIALLGNRRINQSSIAAITGLPRADVKRLLDLRKNLTEAEENHKPVGIQRVVEGWRADPEFVEVSGGRTKVLGRGKSKGSFDRLVAKYSRDVPVAAVLRELLRRRMVVKTTEGISLLRRTPATEARVSANKLVEVFAQLINEFVAIKSRQPRFSRNSARIPVPNSLAMKLANDYLSRAVPLMLEGAVVAAKGGLGRTNVKPSNGEFLHIEVLTASNS